MTTYKVAAEFGPGTVGMAFMLGAAGPLEATALALERIAAETHAEVLTLRISVAEPIE